MFYSLCETVDLPHCNGEDYVVETIQGNELNADRSFVKRRGNHLIAYDKGNGDKAVLITARIDDDKVIIVNTEILGGEGLDERT